ncbi:hypothetical protein Taro_054319 [Colocasia esculenta]|uniref:Uncharacterized protein n=1 Tax=Colocasia esculenta TaxID=4460 RepID=A0A843XQ79_COLES|nr:hypothetical protein [Colocasia esculenta]
MAGGSGKCSKIRCIVRLRQMVRRWRARATASAAAFPVPAARSRRIPSDVPAGHLAVCVGPNARRFVVRAAHLNHPVFRKLLVQAEEEYGFAQSGPLSLPCDEALFEEILRHLNASTGSARFASLEDFQRKLASSSPSRCHHAGARGTSWHESLPLLRGLPEKSSVW